jgi:hypothetical protein
LHEAGRFSFAPPFYTLRLAASCGIIQSTRAAVMMKKSAISQN